MEVLFITKCLGGYDKIVRAFLKASFSFFFFFKFYSVTKPPVIIIHSHPIKWKGIPVFGRDRILNKDVSVEERIDVR